MRRRNRTSQSGGATACWFDQPIADDRRSWAIPSGHGTYRGLELELLDPADEDELMLLLEAQHTEPADALSSAEVRPGRLHPAIAATARRLVAAVTDEAPRTDDLIGRSGPAGPAYGHDFGLSKGAFSMTDWTKLRWLSMTLCGCRMKFQRTFAD